MRAARVTVVVPCVCVCVCVSGFSLGPFSVVLRHATSSAKLKIIGNSPFPITCNGI